MTTEGNSDLFRRLVEEVVNRGELDRAEEFVDAGLVDHYSGPGRAAGIEGFKEAVRTLREAFPDLSIAVERVEGGRIAERWPQTDVPALMRQLRGAPPSERTVSR